MVLIVFDGHLFQILHIKLVLMGVVIYDHLLHNVETQLLEL